MPVHNRVSKKSQSKGGVAREQTAGQVNEHSNADANMQRVKEGQKIEEGTVGIGGQEDTFRPQLQPGAILTDAKGQSQQQRDEHPSAGFARAFFFAEPVARDLEGSAASEKQQGVQIKHLWQREVGPIGGAFANKERAGKGGEAHGDGEDTNPDA